MKKNYEKPIINEEDLVIEDVIAASQQTDIDSIAVDADKDF